MGQAIVKGSRYPMAPGAWKGGIRHYNDVKSGLPVGTIVPYSDASYVITCKFTINYAPRGWRMRAISGQVTYFVIPHCTLQQGQFRVSYYVANRHRSEYAISPDKLDNFIQYVGGYFINALELPRHVNSGSPFISGPRFPTAPDPWKGGIMPYRAVKAQLPRVENVPASAYHVWLDMPVAGPDNSLRRYKTLLVPHVVNLPEPMVKYYIGYDPQLHLNLFAISPDQIDKFARSFWQYYKVAGAFLGADKEFAAQSLAAQYYALHGKWGDAFRALGRAWIDAIQDVDWWLMYFAVPTVSYWTSLARGAAKGWESKIRGKPDTTVTAHAARETHAAETFAVRSEVTEVYLGQEAKTIFKSPAKEKFPDVVAKKKDGSFGLGEGKGTDMRKVIQQFESAGKRINGRISEQLVVVEKLTKQTLPNGRTVSSPGAGWGVDAKNFLINLTNADPATWIRMLVNGQPIKVIVKK